MNNKKAPERGVDVETLSRDEISQIYIDHFKLLAKRFEQKNLEISELLDLNIALGLQCNLIFATDAQLQDHTELFKKTFGSVLKRLTLLAEDDDVEPCELHKITQAINMNCNFLQ